MSTQAKPYQNATKLNARQHQVAINIASGMEQGESYQAVYHCDKRTAIEKASQLLATNAIFKATVERLKKRKEELSLAKVATETLSAQEKRVILAHMARAQLTDFIDERGQPILTKETPNARAAKEFYIKERLDRFGNPVKVSNIKLIDPIAAIQEDNKMAGHYAPSKHMIAQRVQFDVRLVEKGRQEEE
jgi:hypothetical protein